MNSILTYFMRKALAKNPELILKLFPKQPELTQEEANEKIKEKLKEHLEWRKGMDEKIRVIQEEQKRQDIIAFSEYQVKDFANWCMRAVIDDQSILKKWILNGPEFLFKEWKNHREL